MPKRKLNEEGDGEVWLKDKYGRDDDSDIPEDDEDDDDDGKNYEILEEHDIEGQEESTITNDGEVQITPFNMQEEMEEGHFDTQGMFHWNKEKVVRDNWLENIDSVKVKEMKAPAKEESDSEPEIAFDATSAYEQLLKFMKEGETVAAALRRLGDNGRLSASERLKRKKAGIVLNDTGDKEGLTKMTELANGILNKTGDMDIYQKTYQQISDKLKKKAKKLAKANMENAESDMYAEDFEEKINLSSSSDTSEECVTYKWEYKRTGSSELHGPYSTEQMLEWVRAGRFEKKGEFWARPTGTGDGFVLIERMDFEICL